MYDKHYVGLDLTSFSDNGVMRPISRVTLYVDNNSVITAGDDTGLEIVADCPHATQEMADALLAKFKGYKYQAFSADDANLDPAAELGDGVTADGVYSVLARITEDGSGYSDISAPGEAEMEDEYPTLGPITQEFDRKLADTRSSITKTAEQIRLEVAKEVEGITTDISAIDQYAHSLTLSVSNGEISSTIRLMAGSTEISSKEIRFSGVVTFYGLASGTTTIDGACIKTGKISADVLDVDSIRTRILYTSDYSVAITSFGRNYLYIGGDADGYADFSSISIFASDSVSFGYSGDGFTARLFISTNIIDQSIYPSNSAWTLGKSSNPFGGLYLSNNCYLSADGQKLMLGTRELSPDTLYYSSSVYAGLNSNRQFVPASSGTSNGYSIGSSSVPWLNGYFTNLYVGGTAVDKLISDAIADVDVTTDRLQYSSTVYASLNSSRQFLPSASGTTTGYSIGSSTVPWLNGYFTNLYVGSASVHPNRVAYSDSVYAEMDSNRQFLPQDSGSGTRAYSIGSSSKPWYNGYFTNLYVDGTDVSDLLKTNRLEYSSTIYAELNSSRQFLPSASGTTTGYSIGSSSVPWLNGYFTNLYVDGTEFKANRVSYDSVDYAEMNNSRQFVPHYSGSGSLAYSLGSSSLPWYYGYFTNLYVNGTEFKTERVAYDSGNYAELNINRQFVPRFSGSGTLAYSLGSSSYPWTDCYLGVGNISIGSSGTSSGTKIGFFGATPITRLSLSTTTNNQNYTSATASNYLYILNNIAGMLIKYGLIA